MTQSSAQPTPQSPAFVVAIDGPAAAGKGTIARTLAEMFGLMYLDTGALYRATALAVLNKGGNVGDAAFAEACAQQLDASLLSAPELRLESTGEAASRVASYPGVRAALLAYQRSFAQNGGAAQTPQGDKTPGIVAENAVEKAELGQKSAASRGAILDGRDIGTVVWPQASVKLFVTASAEERARRRTLELEARGEHVVFEDILAEVKARDDRDMHRKDAPLKPAADAHLLDTTNLSIEAAVDQAARLVRAALIQ